MECDYCGSDIEGDGVKTDHEDFCDDACAEKYKERQEDQEEDNDWGEDEEDD